MTGRRISQRQAREWRRQLDDFEQREDWRANAWASEWPGGVHIGQAVMPDRLAGCIEAARKLGHAVVVTTAGGNAVNFYAISLQAKQP